MIKSILGKPNDIKKDILISLVKQDEDFTIEHINPENRVGVPTYLIKVDCLYFEDKYHYIDGDKFEKGILSALEGIRAFGNEDMNVGFAENFKLNYAIATSLFIIAKTIPEYDFTVFLNSVEDRNIFDNMANAIEIFKTDVEFRKTTPSVYGKGILTKAMEAVVKKTFKLEDNYKGKTLLIVDTHNQHHRNWHGMPDMRNANDEPTGVIKAFTTMINGLSSFKSDYVIFASEGKKGIRFEIDKDYKGTRSPVADDLKFQINQCNRLTEKMGFSLISEEGFEADDIIGSYARAFENLGGNVIILTSDKDMYQLISDNVKIYDPLKKKYISREDCFEKFFVYPEKVIYSLAIQGDTSDNVPGINGVGVKGAAKLIDAYGDIEGVIANIDKLKGKQKENVENGIDDLRMSYELVRLYDFLAVDVDFNQFKMPTYNPFFLIQEDLERFNINV